MCTESFDHSSASASSAANNCFAQSAKAVTGGGKGAAAPPWRIQGGAAPPPWDFEAKNVLNLKKNVPNLINRMHPLFKLF